MRTTSDTCGSRLKYGPSRSRPGVARMTRTVPAVGLDEVLKTLLEGRKQDLEAGRVYLLKERKPKYSVALFLEYAARGLNPLYITRQHPNHVLPGNGLPVRIVWLSSTLGNDYVDPHNLNGLSHLIDGFVAESDGRGSVVLLDGLEYLTVNNDSERVLKFFDYLGEVVATHRSILLAPVDERALDPKALALFERNAVVLDSA